MVFPCVFYFLHLLQNQIILLLCPKMCYNESRLTKKEYIDLEVSHILQTKRNEQSGIFQTPYT